MRFPALDRSEVSLTPRAEFRGLSIDPEAEHEPATPPVPKIASEGVVAIDITEKFIGATKSKSALATIPIMRG